MGGGVGDEGECKWKRLGGGGECDGGRGGGGWKRLGAGTTLQILRKIPIMDTQPFRDTKAPT
jgi:hypothetical protein